MEKDFDNYVKTLVNQFHGLSVEKCHEEFALINNMTLSSNWTRDRKAWAFLCS